MVIYPVTTWLGYRFGCSRSSKVFIKSKAKVPKTWNELFKAAAKIEKAGFLKPIAHGEHSQEQQHNCRCISSHH